MGTQEGPERRCNFKWIMRNPRIRTGGTSPRGAGFREFQKNTKNERFSNENNPHKKLD